MLGQMIAEISLYSHGESNPNRRNRNPIFYPLNYGNISCHPKGNRTGISCFRHTVIAHSACLECKVNVFFDFYHYL